MSYGHKRSERAMEAANKTQLYKINIIEAIYSRGFRMEILKHKNQFNNSRINFRYFLHKST